MKVPGCPDSTGGRQLSDAPVGVAEKSGTASALFRPDRCRQPLGSRVSRRLATMKSFFNPAAKPSIGWPCNLSLSAALLLILALMTGPWSPAAAASGEATAAAASGEATSHCEPHWVA